MERSKRESPDPSAMRTPASATPASASVARTTRAPAVLEPRESTVDPSSFNTISATKLSLSASIRRTTATSCSERSKAMVSD